MSTPAQPFINMRNKLIDGAQGAEDFMEHPGQSILQLLHLSKPLGMPEPTYQMNWKPEPNAEQAQEIARERQKPDILKMQKPLAGK